MSRVRRFRACRGQLDCRALLGCDISSPEGLQQAKERRLFAKVCPGLVRDAARILEELIG